MRTAIGLPIYSCKLYIMPSELLWNHERKVSAEYFAMTYSPCTIWYTPSGVNVFSNWTLVTTHFNASQHTLSYFRVSKAVDSEVQRLITSSLTFNLKCKYHLYP